MKQRLKTQLNELGLADSEVAEIIRQATVLELPTRHVLIQQGAVPEAFYFLIEGICHACYLTEAGKVFSKEFYWENDWIIGFESLIREQPSPFLLESLSPVVMFSLPVQTLLSWRQQSHPLYQKLLETQLMYKEGKERFMLLHPPEQRYQLFCKHHPDMLPRLSDQQIAAYLGITPISLSRIKARLNKG